MKNKLLNVFKILLAAALLTVIILNYDYLSNLDIRELISSASSVFAAAAIVLGVYFLKSLVFVVPASLIYVSVGMAFDTKTALLINTVGIALEVTATFIMGRFLGKDAVEKKLSGTKAGNKLLNMKSKNKSLFGNIFQPLNKFYFTFCTDGNAFSVFISALRTPWHNNSHTPFFYWNSCLKIP